MSAIILQMLLPRPDKQRLTQPQLCPLLLCAWLPVDALAQDALSRPLTAWPRAVPCCTEVTRIVFAFVSEVTYMI